MVRCLAVAGFAGMRVRERISQAVKTRFEIVLDEREAVRRAVTILAMPRNAGLGAQMIYRTVDAIWRAAGDEASDWNFYSKRGLLAGGYVSAVFFWLQDESLECQDTKAFIDRRIADVMRLPTVMKKLRGPFGSLAPRARPQAPRL